MTGTVAGTVGIGGDPDRSTAEGEHEVAGIDGCKGPGRCCLTDGLSS